MKFKLLDAVEKTVGTFELSQKQIEEDFAYTMEEAIAKILNISWIEVFLDGMDENMTGLDLYKRQKKFHIVTMLTTKHKMDYTVIACRSNIRK